MRGGISPNEALQAIWLPPDAHEGACIMYSLETIRRLNHQASIAARRAGRQPVRIDPEAIADCPPFPIPYVGANRFADWANTGVFWFVDLTRWGADDEPALTIEQFKTVLLEYVLDHPDHGFGLVECGPFQGYVAAFRPVKHRRRQAPELNGGRP
jgi:hypothetical protein